MTVQPSSFDSADTSPHLFRRYWRILVVGVVTAVLAFGVSLLVPPTYESSTRLMVHGRSATFLASTGQDLSGRPGVIDTTLSQGLLYTYAGLATSRTVATAVSDQLELDQVPGRAGRIGSVTRAIARFFRCGQAFVTSGFCVPVDPRERAILAVQAGITAEPVGTEGDAGSGQPGSYVLEVHASGANPAQAKAVTDAVADRLVILSNERFASDASANVDKLRTQVEATEGLVRVRYKAMAEFQTANNISAADARQALTAETVESIRASLIAARAALDDTRAQAASVQGSLAQVPKDLEEKQIIVTGRSTTELNTAGTNSVYNDLSTRLSTLKAREAGLVARVQRLQAQLAEATPLKNNGPLAELTVLKQRSDLAALNLRNLTTTLQRAETTAAAGSEDLSRLDDAAQPTYPATPKRYMYLVIGLLVGALAGAVRTPRVSRPRRRNPSLLDPTATAAAPPYTNGRAGNIDRDALDLVLGGRLANSPKETIDTTARGPGPAPPR